jgi:HD-like signal output (HDOD) protein
MLRPITDDPGVPPPDNVLKYFRAVGEPSELPLLPSVAGQVLKMVKDPDFNARELCRVLSNDAALAGRILAVSRSPYYAQRMRPRALLEAITVLGFRTVTSVVLATAGHTLCVKGNKTSEKLWNHSVGVALATRILCKRAGFRDSEQAFLAGLMHDIGESILLYRDPYGFEKLVREVQRSQCRMIDKEQEAYGFDHTLAGSALLESWGIASPTRQAALDHDRDLNGDTINELTVILAAAEYLCFKANLGFFGALPPLRLDTMIKCKCDDDQRSEEVVHQICEAYGKESPLFKPLRQDC